MVGLSKPPVIKEILSIEGISLVEKVEHGMFRIHIKSEYIPAEEIVSISIKKGWGLFHIAPDITSLEDIFVQLTQMQPK